MKPIASYSMSKNMPREPSGMSGEIFRRLAASAMMATFGLATSSTAPQRPHTTVTVFPGARTCDSPPQRGQFTALTPVSCASGGLPNQPGTARKFVRLNSSNRQYLPKNARTCSLLYSMQPNAEFGPVRSALTLSRPGGAMYGNSPSQPSTFVSFTSATVMTTPAHLMLLPA